MEHSNTTPSKIPILDTGKFEQWKFKIQQYLQHEHYALWEVIEFGDSYEVPKEGATTGSASDGKKGRIVAVTTEDMQKRKNDVKARTTLLLALPDEHQLRFSKYKMAQELWAAILKTFDGNEATRKTKKHLLKQQYGNFKAEGKETLEQTFNGFLAPEWLVHTLMWRNISDLDTMSLDDLYNHLKVYESEVQKKSDSHNMAFISSSKNSSGNEEVNTTSVPTASTQVSPAGANVAPASISLDTACAYIASQSNDSRIKYEDINQIDEDDIEEMDIKESRAHRSQERGRRDNYRQGSKVEEQALTALMKIDEVGWDWSYMENKEENHALVADEEVPTEFALMAKSGTDNETLKKEKEGLDSKLLGFKLATKDLDNLIGSQRSDKNKEDDTITNYTRPSPSVESNLNDLQNNGSSVSKIGESTGSILSKPKIKFVKAADSPIVVKTDKKETVRKPTVKYAKLYRKTSKRQLPDYIDDKSYWDSGCSRHITGNISYLSDYEPFDGGYVSFGQGGCMITGKQHKASCKTKLVNSVTKPFYTLHMDLFGPTSDETSGILRNFIIEIENLKDLKVKIIRCDNGGEFRNKEMNDFCLRKRIKREFSNARTPQQNRVAERRNMTLIKAARTMLADTKLPVTFWAEAVNTTCYVQNRVLVNKSQNKTPYELFNGRTLAIGFLKPFGYHVMILNTLDNLGKFEAKGDEGYFIGGASDACNADAPKSSGNSNPTATFTNPPADHMETLAVETLIPTVSSPVPTACLNDSPGPSSDTRLIFKRVTSQDDTPFLDNILTLTNRFEDIIGVSTNSDESNRVEADLSNMENNISASPTPTLRIHKDHLKSHIIGPVDTPVQTRTKSKEDSEFPTRVYKVEKAMYGLHQAPRAWQRGDFILVHVYVDDINFRSSNPQLCREFEALMHEKFQMSVMGDILKKFRYSDVRSSNTPMDKENPWRKDRIGKDVDLHLYRSMIGSLMYLTASRPDIMFVICACARHQVTPKECHLHAVKRIFIYLKGHPKLGLWYPKESPFNLVAYSDSDYGGATQDCKSTTRGDCFEKKLISVDHIHTDDNVADLLTKPFDAGRFQYLVVEQAMRGYVKGNHIIYTTFKYDLNIDFHQIVGFVDASHLRIETMDEGTKILAIVDGKLRTIFESSIRRNIKLKDEAGISSLPDVKLFENLTLMAYNILPNQKFTFQKGQFSHQWKYLIHTIMQCLSPKSTGFNEFSSNIATALVCLATNRVYNLSKIIFNGEGSRTLTEPHHTPSPEAQQTSPTTHSSPSLLPSSALSPVADEHASLIGNDSQGEACPTNSGLKAEQDRANITKTSTFPSDLTPRVTSLAADEGSMQQQLNELMDLCTRLEGGGIAQSGEDATIKGRSLDEGAEAAIDRSMEKGSNDTEEMVNVLTSLDAATVLSSGVFVSISPITEVYHAEVPTGSGSIPTASPPGTGVPTGSDMVPTASLIFTTATMATPYTRRKGKEKMVESETPKKKKIQEQMDVQMVRQLEEEMERDAQRMNEQIDRDAKIARIYAKEELQIMIDGLDRNNKTVAKQLFKSSQVPDTAKKAPLKEATERVLYVSAQESLSGSKEESERFKRKGIRLEQDNDKKVKTSEEVPKENLKEMMQLIPVEEVYVEALQVKHPIIDWEGRFESTWALVKETLNIRQDTSDKEKEIWVELKRLYEPDVKDLLWTYTQNMMHDPVEWGLYDSCGVYHVQSKDQEIFMLVEKEYPLRKGLAIAMIINKLQVVQIVLWYLDSGCSKHMTRDRSRLRNFVKKFIGTVRFRNDHFGAIMGYEDYVIGDSMIHRVYYMEGLGQNLFSVGQFCDSDLKVAFRKHSCYVRDTDGVELIKGSRGSNLYTISVEDMLKYSLTCLLSKASKYKSWLWHHRLNHLNFSTINDLAKKDLVKGLPRLKFEKDHLCLACQLGKSKKHTHKPKAENINLEVLNTLYMDLCGPMGVQTINEKKYILVMVDYYSSVGIFHQKSVPRTSQQNGIVERPNRTLVKVARTMLIFSKALMFLWEEAVATACYTQNRSLIYTRHNKNPIRAGA
uniref:Uncharacterized mitochondrial protein AtMg00810-like n=1 Tax=Tanacetum cinerariifolium TaxID=118510 RepID=A0A6L2JV85_TANCI|nr:uncharacterized mitochondrial protein AtMg00810-like [Tanacetum cinerariifolium]